MKSISHDHIDNFERRLVERVVQYPQDNTPVIYVCGGLILDIFMSLSCINIKQCLDSVLGIYTVTVNTDVIFDSLLQEKM